MTRYNVLAIVAVITVPLAPAILFGWNLYNYLMGKGVPVWLAIVGGVAGAVSLEAVGILAGHVGMVYLKRRDWRVLFPAIAMLFYAGYGYVKTPEYGGVFILAALVYVLVALQGEADTAVKQELADTAVSRAHEWQQEQEDAAHRRQMETERLRLAHEERLAKISAKSQVTAKTEVDTSKTDWRLMSDTERLRLLDFTPGEIVSRYQVSNKTAGRWLERAGDLSRKMSANGHAR